MVQKIAGRSCSRLGFSNKGKIRQRKERDGFRLSFAVPKIQWDSNPTVPIPLKSKPYFIDEQQANLI